MDLQGPDLSDSGDTIFSDSKDLVIIFSDSKDQIRSLKHLRKICKYFALNFFSFTVKCSLSVCTVL